MARPNLHAFALKRLVDECIEQIAIHQVGTGQLRAVPREFFLERRGRVHAHRFGFEHLQLEVHKELHVVVQRLNGVHAVAVVLAIHVLEIREGDHLAAHFEDVGLSVVLGAALALGQCG